MQGGTILPAAAFRNTLGPHFPVLQSITYRRNTGLISQAFAHELAGWRCLASWRELAGPFSMACFFKGKWHSAWGRLTACAGLMQLTLDCRGQTGWGGAAVVPAAPISACMAETTISPHLSPPHLQHPKTWPLRLVRRKWGLARDEGAEGQAVLCVDEGGRGYTAEWG